MVKKLADKLQEDLNKKITKAFEQNTDMEKEEEIKRRDE
jgi:ribosomal protein S17E